MTDRQPHSEDDSFELPPGGRRYYFDSRDGDTFIKDDMGLVLSSIEEARDQAAVCLAEMANTESR